ncbi:tRNA (adenosine(37)-N6)-threonylcarbamoyltransferase complex ATPase subunit type 1 TsaE [Mycoplasma sp. 1578d]|nr:MULTISPECIES: tRNA (adenosine(37)-N6)-threonylcarbamoyltransferase complex ATPase subunit type 1 TsaE [unclassified Mycoplasma]UUM20142.1 tRNA (adenosine(37)-N6)-threonylcarbamoyltransferase complex ATPase subunit type 1 TsaE [Mycoplasma sp. 1578d]UUM25138.1 tRNA (adenosine(37)-N6)-threonylcarbamoyltransferase complex ATPase subunit type 1 TsaE [Mycoplasma sp. 3686d]
MDQQESVNLFIDLIFPHIQECKMVLLQGDLGAGKTTIVKYIAQKLRIKDNITSPSFSYMKTYPGLVHIDLYNYKGDLDEFEDYFEDNIVAIEWSNLKKLAYQQYVLIDIKFNNDKRDYQSWVVK